MLQNSLLLIKGLNKTDTPVFQSNPRYHIDKICLLQCRQSQKAFTLPIFMEIGQKLIRSSKQ